MQSCAFCRSQCGFYGLSKGSVIAAWLILLGCALLPHGPLPGPGRSGIVCGALHKVSQPHALLQTHTNLQYPNELMCFSCVLTVSACGESGHSHHRPVPTAPEEAGRERDTGPGHRCRLFSADTAIDHRGTKQQKHLFDRKMLRKRRKPDYCNN